MAFPDGISIPGRNHNHEVAGPVRNGLARQTAGRCQTRRIGKLVRLCIAHFRQSLPSLLNDAVTRRTGAHASTGMVNVDPMSQGDIQNASRQPIISIRNLFGVYFDGDIHWHERNRELLSRGFRRFLRQVRIRTTHIYIIGYGRGASCGPPG